MRMWSPCSLALDHQRMCLTIDWCHIIYDVYGPLASILSATGGGLHLLESLASYLR